MSVTPRRGSCSLAKRLHGSAYFNLPPGFNGLNVSGASGLAICVPMFRGVVNVVLGVVNFVLGVVNFVLGIVPKIFGVVVVVVVVPGVPKTFAGVPRIRGGGVGITPTTVPVPDAGSQPR